MTADHIVSYCGLTCIGCPVFWATKENNLISQKRMRMKIAQYCNEKYSTHYTYTDITDCDGCKSITGRLFSGCINCKIRKCAEGRNFSTCAQCGEYPCKELEKHFASEPGSRIKLEVIKSKLEG